MIRKVIFATLVVASGFAAVAAPASAAGGNGASTCSGSSGPDGIVVDGDFSTYNSAGEIISFNSRHGLQPRGGAPGQVVKAICNAHSAG